MAEEAIVLREIQPGELTDLTEMRVRRIMAAMLDATWNAALAQTLADEWGVRVTSLTHAAAEASRRIQYIVESTDIDWRSMIISGVQAIAADALANKDRSNALRAYQLLSEIHGIKAPQRIALSEDLSGLSDEQLEARRAHVLRQLGKGSETK